MLLGLIRADSLPSPGFTPLPWVSIALLPVRTQETPCLGIQFFHRENAYILLESLLSPENPSNPCFSFVSSHLPVISYPISRNRCVLPQLIPQTAGMLYNQSDHSL